MKHVDSLIVFSNADYTSDSGWWATQLRRIVYRSIQPIAPLVLQRVLESEGYTTRVRTIQSVSKRQLASVDKVVLLSCNATLEFPRWIALAEKIRAQRPELPILLGGVHVNVNFPEAREIAEKTGLFVPVRGRGENTLGAILRDIEQGTLESFYDDPTGAANFREHYVPPSRPFGLHLFDSVEASVGCPDHCTFCSAIVANKRFQRRALDTVVREIDEIKLTKPTSIWHRFTPIFFTDDNITALPNDYLKGLLGYMNQHKIRWLGEGSLFPQVMQDHDLLEALGQGCLSLLVGVEDLSGTNVAESLKIRDVPDIIAHIHKCYSYNIPIIASIVVGLDGHTRKSFEILRDAIVEYGIVPALFVATPYPGTPWYSQLEEEGRILNKDYNDYDTRKVIFQPSHMSPDELVENYHWLRTEVYRHQRKIFRTVRSKGVTKNQLVLGLQHMIVQT